MAAGISNGILGEIPKGIQESLTNVLKESREDSVEVSGKKSCRTFERNPAEFLEKKFPQNLGVILERNLKALLLNLLHESRENFR